MGGAVKIRAIRLHVTTPAGDFGFNEVFSRTLTIVRGGNSSGKSTFFNTILFGLGMEELIGGRGDRTLPYAVKDYFEFGGDRIPVSSSEVLIEIENGAKEIVTLRRSIRDNQR